MTELTTNHFLYLSAALFVIGLMGVLVRRNLLIMFMCVELMMNSVNLSLIAFARETNTMFGEGFALFTIAVAGSFFVFMAFAFSIGYGKPAVSEGRWAFSPAPVSEMAGRATISCARPMAGTRRSTPSL